MPLTCPGIVVSARQPRTRAGAGSARALWRRRWMSSTACPSLPTRPRFAIIGAGLAGISVSWHLLSSAVRLGTAVDLEVFCRGDGIGDEASGAAAGLLHPLTPRGRPAWQAQHAWAGALELANAATLAAERAGLPRPTWKGQILRLAQSPAQVGVGTEL